MINFFANAVKRIRDLLKRKVPGRLEYQKQQALTDALLRAETKLEERYSQALEIYKTEKEPREQQIELKPAKDDRVKERIEAVGGPEIDWFRDSYMPGLTDDASVNEISLKEIVDAMVKSSVIDDTAADRKRMREAYN